MSAVLENVVLAPGLWMPSAAMVLLAARLARFVREACGERPAHFIGHSLGGVPCGELWQERDAAWARKAPPGVVAGTLPLGLGRAFGRLPGVNDGVVRVEETDVEGMTERVLVPVGHSLLIASAAVGRLVERFMAYGRFA